MNTYEGVHAGDIILGDDGQLWGVADIQHLPQLAVRLVRHGQQITGYPPASTAVTVVAPADMDGPRRACDVLISRGLGPIQIISEHWESE